MKRADLKQMKDSTLLYREDQIKNTINKTNNDLQYQDRHLALGLKQQIQPFNIQTNIDIKDNNQGQNRHLNLYQNAPQQYYQDINGDSIQQRPLFQNMIRNQDQQSVQTGYFEQSFEDDNLQSFYAPNNKESQVSDNQTEKGYSYIEIDMSPNQEEYVQMPLYNYLDTMKQPKQIQLDDLMIPMGYN